MDKSSDVSQTIAKVIENWIDDYGYSHEFTQAKVFSAWREIADQLFPRNSDAISLVDGKLKVRVSNSALMSEILLLPDLAQQINQKVGRVAVKKIEGEMAEFRQIRTQKRSSIDQRRNSNDPKYDANHVDENEISDRQKKKIETITDRIENDQLKESLKTVFVKMAKREKIKN